MTIEWSRLEGKERESSNNSLYKYTIIEKDWRKTPLSDLGNYIVTHHHYLLYTLSKWVDSSSINNKFFNTRRALIARPSGRLSPSKIIICYLMRKQSLKKRLPLAVLQGDSHSVGISCERHLRHLEIAAASSSLFPPEGDSWWIEGRCGSGTLCSSSLKVSAPVPSR